LIQLGVNPDNNVRMMRYDVNFILHLEYIPAINMASRQHRKEVLDVLCDAGAVSANVRNDQGYHALDELFFDDPNRDRVEGSCPFKCFNNSYTAKSKLALHYWKQTTLSMGLRMVNQGARIDPNLTNLLAEHLTVLRDRDGEGQLAWSQANLNNENMYVRWAARYMVQATERHVNLSRERVLRYVQFLQANIIPQLLAAQEEYARRIRPEIEGGAPILPDVIINVVEEYLH
jgi:hypothetical protein